MPISVWIRERPQRACLGPLPAEVELHLIHEDRALPAGIEEAEFLVPPHDCGPLLEKLAEMPRLAVVQAASAGTDWLEPWVPQGVALCSARGARDNAVAEWVLTVILTMEKRIGELGRAQGERAWRPFVADELAGQRALVVGAGAIGGHVASMLKGLGVEVEEVASSARAEVRGVQDLPELLPQADIVVLLVPLTAETRGMFDEQMLSLMRHGALLVNASRGPVVNTAALLEALKSGRIRAALDVTDPEPLPSEHPLWEAPGVLVTPHLAGDSPQAEERAYSLIGDQIRRYANGEELLNRVDR